MTTETAELVRHEVAFQGYFRVGRYYFRHTLHNGGMSNLITREVFERGQAGAVLLYDPRPGDEAASSLHVAHATVKLYADTSASTVVALGAASDIAVTGTQVSFDDVVARVVRIELDDVIGTFYGLAVASLAEVEMVARGEAIATDDTIFRDGFEP